MALLLFSCSGCSPVYVARAGWAEMKILKGRRPLDEVIEDQRTDEETRHKLLLARQARAFAIHRLGMDAGDSYTSFTQLETDTLAWVLSAAYQGSPRIQDLVVPHRGPGPLQGVRQPEGRREGPGEAGGRGLRHLPPHHLGLQHPGLVRRSPPLQPPPVRRCGAGGRPSSTNSPTTISSCRARSSSTRASRPSSGGWEPSGSSVARTADTTDTGLCHRPFIGSDDYQTTSPRFWTSSSRRLEGIYDSSDPDPG